MIERLAVRANRGRDRRRRRRRPGRGSSPGQQFGSGSRAARSRGPVGRRRRAPRGPSARTDSPRRSAGPRGSAERSRSRPRLARRHSIGADREAGPRRLAEPVVDERHRRHVELEVRRRQAGPRPYERARLGDGEVSGPRPRACHCSSEAMFSWSYRSLPSVRQIAPALRSGPAGSRRRRAGR